MSMRFHAHNECVGDNEEVSCPQSSSWNIFIMSKDVVINVGPVCKRMHGINN